MIALDSQLGNLNACIQCTLLQETVELRRGDRERERERERKREREKERAEGERGKDKKTTRESGRRRGIKFIPLCQIIQ